MAQVAHVGGAHAMPGRFVGRLWHALKRYLGQEIVGLIAQFLAGLGIIYHWDLRSFLIRSPKMCLLRLLLHVQLLLCLCELFLLLQQAGNDRQPVAISV